MQFLLSKIKLLSDVSIHSSHILGFRSIGLKKILWTIHYIHTSKSSSELMHFGHVFQLKGPCPVLVVSSLVITESAFTRQNTVMATQTAKISLMNLTVVSSYFWWQNVVTWIWLTCSIECLPSYFWSFCLNAII